jgi:hypothetical protein
MLRSVAMPTEHGGWSLTLEPVLLALIVAWSWSGFALGAAALLAFVARTPIKVVLVDRWRHRWLDRTRLAARVAGVEFVVLVVLVAIAASTADGRFWVPFATVIVLAAVGVANIVALRFEPRPPKVLGVQQMIFGLAVTAVTATAILAA